MGIPIIRAHWWVEAKNEHGLSVLSDVEKENHLSKKGTTTSWENLITYLVNSTDDPTPMRGNAAINHTSEEGGTPLHLAAFIGKPKIVTYLLQCNAQIKVVDSLGRNALHWAALSRSSTSIPGLLKANVDAVALDNEGNTPLDLAITINSLGNVQTLVLAGVPIGPKQLKLARTLQYTEILDFLVKTNAEFFTRAVLASKDPFKTGVQLSASMFGDWYN